jgi:hypothetical protein
LAKDLGKELAKELVKKLALRMGRAEDRLSVAMVWGWSVLMTEWV